jgi:hypothetical protein
LSRHGNGKQLVGLMEDEFSHTGNVLVYVDVCRAGTIGTIHSADASRAVENPIARPASEGLRNDGQWPR